MSFKTSYRRYFPSARVISISLLGLLLNACAINSDVNDPVDLVWDKSDVKTDSLIIFLPGLFQAAELFKKERFFLLARQAGIKADMVAASIHLDHLLEGKVIERLEKDIFNYAKEKKYKNIWMAGVSLGGLNSLLFYKKYSKQICGVVVLAPYLAGKSLAEEITNAGGIRKWFSGPEKEKSSGEREILEQHRLWMWIKNQNRENKLGNIYLGIGKKDIYFEANNILADILRKENVTIVEGKHDLDTAREIWKKQLMTRKRTGLFRDCN